MSEEKSALVGARVEPELKRRAVEKAKQADLPLSWYIRQWLKRWVAGDDFIHTPSGELPPQSKQE